MRRTALLTVVGLAGIAIGVLFVRDGSRGERPSRSPPVASDAADVGVPRSIAAIGDSITQAVNVGYGSGDGALMHSWATGRDTSDPVVSHLERLSGAGGSSDVVAYNNSLSGARMIDAPRQAALTVSQGAQYITFLMGANDACTSSRFTMTSVRLFTRSFRRAIAILMTGLPDALVYVVSIPDVHRLWEVLRPNPQAHEAWRVFGTCGALLAEQRGEDDRLRVRDRVRRFNDVLKEVCESHERCLYDGGAVFRYRFTAEDVSTLDFFHPSILGQSHLADVTWRHGPFAQLDPVSP
jgi:lysophospholipase L1-like esterase